MNMKELTIQNRIRVLNLKLIDMYLKSNAF